MYAVTLIVLSYGLFVAVELVRRVQLLCEKHTQAISPISASNYNMFYFCTLSRVMVWDVLEWDKVGECVVQWDDVRDVRIQYPYIEQTSNIQTPLTQKAHFTERNDYAHLVYILSKGR